MKKLVIFVFISFICMTAYAQQPLHGKITGNVQWSGIVHIDGDLIITSSAVLKINAGTRIIVSANHDAMSSGKDKSKTEIIVKGVVIARGEPDKKIVFTSGAAEPMMADWYGITIRNKNKTFIMDYAVIEYGYFGLNIIASKPLIMNSEIRYNYMAGINADMRSAPTIQGCAISGNDYAGIKCDYGSAPVISESVITQNGHGVIAFNKSAPFLGKIENRKAIGGKNRIFENWETNIYNHSSATIYAQNNNWLTTSSGDIDKHIYDKNDESQYGPVIYKPLEGERLVRQAPPVLAAKNVNKKSQENVAQNTNQNTNIQKKKEVVDSKKSNLTPEHKNKTKTDQSPVLANNIKNKNTQPSQKTDTVAQPVEKIDAEAALKENEKKKKERRLKENSAFADILNLKKPALEYQLDNKPIKRVKMVPAEYPPAYRNTGRSGRVFVKVVVNTNGVVEAASILKIQGGDEFGKSALKAVKQFKYSVGTFKGQPVRFEKTELFDFKM